MATVNRCPHVGGPDDAIRCGCPLDFDCPHGGTCETEDECVALDTDEEADDEEVLVELVAASVHAEELAPSVGKLQVRCRKGRWVVYQPVLGRELLYGNWSSWPQACLHAKLILSARAANPTWVDTVLRRVMVGT
jgi:hypothetical protein